MCFYMTMPGKEVNEGVIAVAAVCDTDPYSLEEKSESIRREDRRQMMTPSSLDDTVALRYFFQHKDLLNSSEILFL